MSYFEDYIEDGLCCEGCGAFLDGDEPGFVRYCAGCEPGGRPTKAKQAHKPARYPSEVKGTKPYSCQVDGCGKRFATPSAKRNHRKMKHGISR